MTTSAWIFLAVSWAIIIVSALYCFAKLLSSGQGLGDGDGDDS